MGRESERHMRTLPVPDCNTQMVDGYRMRQLWLVETLGAPLRRVLWGCPITSLEASCGNIALTEEATYVTGTRGPHVLFLLGEKQALVAIRCQPRRVRK